MGSRSPTTTRTASSTSTSPTTSCRASCFRNRKDGTFEETALLAGVSLPEHGQDDLGDGRRLPRLRQRRAARPPRHRAGGRELPPLPEPGQGPLPGRDASQPARARSWPRAAAGATGSSTSTTTAGRTSSPPTPTSTTRSSRSEATPTGCPTASSATGGRDVRATRRPRPASTPARARAHRGAAFGDLDQDGRVDVVVTRARAPGRAVAEPVRRLPATGWTCGWSGRRATATASARW